VLKEDCIQPKADYCSETTYENKILWQISVKKKFQTIMSGARTTPPA